METYVYKIFREAEWREAQPRGIFDGSPDDLRDGFIHLSSADQVEATAAKHFAGGGDLVLVSFEAAALGHDLKWEPSRGGALFPHLYAALDLSAATMTQTLPLSPDGRRIIPQLPS